MSEAALVTDRPAFDPVVFKANQREAWSAVAEGWSDGVGRAMAQLSMPLVDYAGVQPGDRVLDLASGGGTASFAAATAGAREVIATDLAPGFRSIIEGSARDLGFEGVVSFAEVDMEQIPYSDNEFDRVLCQLGIMFPPNRAKALSEIYRVLKPGGTFGAATLASIEENPEVSPIIMYPASLLNGPRNAPHPFICGDREAVESEFKTAGFEQVESRDFTMLVRHATIEEGIESWTNTAPVAFALSKLPASRKTEVVDRLRQELAKHERPDGSVEMKMLALLFRGVKR